ncbi:hypothetical protein BASA61_003942 [Batrachochytrium salamandrivorans]|nr:hypothetical protein BASA61_003942 [Batrachochytrium salamandrivorans]
MSPYASTITPASSIPDTTSQSGHVQLLSDIDPSLRSSTRMATARNTLTDSASTISRSTTASISQRMSIVSVSAPDRPAVSYALDTSLPLSLILAELCERHFHLVAEPAAVSLPDLLLSKPPLHDYPASVVVDERPSQVLHEPIYSTLPPMDNGLEASTISTAATHLQQHSVSSLPNRNSPQRSCDYALRVCSTNELITDDMLKHNKVPQGANLTLGLAAHLLVSSFCHSLTNPKGDNELKKTVFLLQRYLKESDFRTEFLKANGFIHLQDVAVRVKNNTFAYVLGCICVIIDQDAFTRSGVLPENTVSDLEPCPITLANSSWCQFTNGFIEQLVASQKSEIIGNICRPINHICTWLLKSSAQRRSTDQLCKLLCSQPAVLKKMVNRISSPSSEVQLGSMMLLNALLQFSPEKRRGVLMRIVDSFGVRKIVSQLMGQESSVALHDSLVGFQQIVILDYHKGKQTRVDLQLAAHKKTMDEIWSFSDILQDGDRKWRLIGFQTEDPVNELVGVGVLGLANFHYFIQKNLVEYKQLISDQLTLPCNVRCPIACAAIEVCEILTEIWNISTEDPRLKTYQPLFLLFEDSFAITLRAFFCLWVDMKAQMTHSDIKRVAQALRTHVHLTINNIRAVNNSVLHLFQSAMMDISAYSISDRKSKTMAAEILSEYHPSYVEVKRRLTVSAQEFMRQQRLSSMMKGAVFTRLDDEGRDIKGARLYRLDCTQTKIMWVDIEENLDEGFLDIEYSDHVLISDILDLKVGPYSSVSSPTRGNVSYPLRFEATFKLPSEEKAQTSLSTPPPPVMKSEKYLVFQCKSIHQYGCWLDGLTILIKGDMENLPTVETNRCIRDIAENHMAVWRISQEDVCEDAVCGLASMRRRPAHSAAPIKNLFVDNKGQSLVFTVTRSDSHQQVCSAIVKHGGIVDANSSNPFMNLVAFDHITTSPNMYYSYFIDDCISAGRLLSKEDYLLTITTSRISHRCAFDEEDDRILTNHLLKFSTGRLHGNKLYQSFAEHHPKHSWHSWRHHAIKHILHRLEFLQSKSPVVATKAGRVSGSQETKRNSLEHQPKVELHSPIQSDQVVERSRPDYLRKPNTNIVLEIASPPISVKKLPSKRVFAASSSSREDEEDISDHSIHDRQKKEPPSSKKHLKSEDSISHTLRQHRRISYVDISNKLSPEDPQPSTGDTPSQLRRSRRAKSTSGAHESTYFTMNHSDTQPSKMSDDSLHSTHTTDTLQRATHSKGRLPARSGRRGRPGRPRLSRGGQDIKPTKSPSPPPPPNLSIAESQTNESDKENHTDMGTDEVDAKSQFLIHVRILLEDAAAINYQKRDVVRALMMASGIVDHARSLLAVNFDTRLLQTAIRRVIFDAEDDRLLASELQSDHDLLAQRKTRVGINRRVQFLSD